MLFLLGRCVLLTLTIMYANASITAYKCPADKLETNYNPFNTDECTKGSENNVPEEEHIRIVHLNKFYKNVVVLQCRMLKTYLRTGCGENSHIYALPDGLRANYRRLSKQRCDEMHSKRVLKVDGRKFYLRNNHVNVFSYITENELFGNKSCRNSGPITQVIVEVTLRTIMVDLDVWEDDLRLPNIRVKYSKKFIDDPMYGFTYWYSYDSCPNSRHTILYEGTARKYHSKIYNTTVYYSLKKNEEFAIPVRERINDCDHIFFKTAYHDLLIEATTGKVKYDRNKIKKNFRATEFNVALPVVELELLPDAMKTQKCLRRALTDQMLYLNSIDSTNEYDQNRKNCADYNVINCKEVAVEIRKTSECYDLIPIIYNGSNTFMTIRTHIIKENATEIDCSLSELPLSLS